ncbi:LysE family translocator [Pseudoruegeria sp. HB172150]|uniref:LysE family translocator n=1 Tax=Pseudoruegeria sp. HB172150 TaxID=2721164 RepID=UPI0015534833|nr:LysE family translocator [Pseudoruegeria sp. HB172150]
MDLAHLLAFNIAIIGALASPGPAFLSVMRSSLTGGRRAGILCAIGLAVAVCVWSLLAIVGLTALFALVPWAYLALKIAGAGYLIWLAVSLWRNADKPVETGDGKGLSGFRLGLFVNLSNPKAVFFVAAIFATVFPEMPRGADAALILANHFVLEALWYSGCALIFASAPVRSAYMRAKAWLDRAAAAILGLLAVRIAS